jgi:hypothetical protein
MELQIEMLPPQELTPYERNSRTHTPEQIRQIEASIREHGFVNPVLIGDDGVIIAGHGRVTAARNLGMDKVPCVRLAHLTEAQRRAYIIADNRLAELAGWDKAILAGELEILQEMDYDLELIGYSDDEIDMLLGDDLEVMESAGSMSSSNYGDVRSERIPVNIMGIGGLLDRELLERVKERLVEHGAEAGADNGEHLVTIFEAYLR